MKNNLYIFAAAYNDLKTQKSEDDNYIYKLLVKPIEYDDYEIVLKIKNLINNRWQNFKFAIRIKIDSHYLTTLLDDFKKDKKNRKLAKAIFNYILFEYIGDDLDFMKFSGYIKNI